MTGQPTVDESAVVDRLDRLIGLLSFAFAEQIEAASSRIREDAVAVAILEASATWVPSGELQAAAVAASGAAKRTIQRKLTELRNLGAISSRGAGSATQYRATGVVR